MNIKKLAVFGLGRSGLSVIKALGREVEIIAWDDDEEARAQTGAPCETLTQENLSTCDALILAPGVPLDHEVARAAQKAAAEMICDIELFSRLYPDIKTVGITGTNGKSTTTALIAHILNEAGLSAVAAGNIGVPVFDVDGLNPPDVLVLELSSFQLELCPNFAPDIGVLLNITPDHIDRHGTFENYKAIKLAMIEKSALSVIEDDNEIAASKVAAIFGVSDKKIAEAVKSFPGLPHRRQLVRTIGSVQYINDSKATNAESTAYALKRFKNIVLIAGGRGKEGGLKSLKEKLNNVKHVFLIGETQEDFARWLSENNVPYTKCNILDKAVPEAYKFVQAMEGNATVLLSPACSSYDQYKNFEQRGAHFEELVKQLPEGA